MGHWRLNTTGPCIIISSGVVGMANKKEEAADFSIGYNKLKTLIETDPLHEIYTMSKPSFISLGKALQNRPYELLGQREIVERSIDIDSDPKRYCENGPIIGKDILENQYSTTPWDIHFIMGNKLVGG